MESKLVWRLSEHVVSGVIVLFLGVVAFLVLGTVQLLIISYGMEIVRKASDFAGPVVWVGMIVLGVWILGKADWSGDLNARAGEVERLEVLSPGLPLAAPDAPPGRVGCARAPPRRARALRSFRGWRSTCCAPPGPSGAGAGGPRPPICPCRTGPTSSATGSRSPPSKTACPPCGARAAARGSSCSTT